MKYPEHKTDWGCLLAEIINGSTYKQRIRATFFYWGYRRGFSTFQSWLQEYDERNPHPSIYVGQDHPDECDFLESVLSLIGFMETNECLEYLTHVARDFHDDSLRASALEAMYFTGLPLDVEFLMSFLGADTATVMKLSALYSLRYQIRSEVDWQRIRENALRLFQHENINVRMFTIELLRCNVANADLIRPFLDDQNPKMVEAAKNAFEIMEDISVPLQ